MLHSLADAKSSPAGLKDIFNRKKCLEIQTQHFDLAGGNYLFGDVRLAHKDYFIPVLPFNWFVIVLLCYHCRMDDAEACFILSSRNDVDRMAAVRIKPNQ